MTDANELDRVAFRIITRNVQDLLNRIVGSDELPEDWTDRLSWAVTENEYASLSRVIHDINYRREPESGMATLSEMRILGVRIMAVPKLDVHLEIRL